MAQQLTIQKYPVWFNHYQPHLTIASSTKFNKILYIFKILNILYKNYNFYINPLTQTFTPTISFVESEKQFLTLTMSQHIDTYMRQGGNNV